MKLGNARTPESMSERGKLGDRFSAGAFAGLGLDSDEAALLAIELEQVIGECIFSKLKEGAEHVVAQLNELGHCLLLDEEQTDDPMLPIGISYRDETEMSSGKALCKLRVAFDLTVSCGYAHVDEDELDNARVR